MDRNTSEGVALRLSACEQADAVGHDNEKKQNATEEVTYWSLLRHNPSFRFFFVSYCVNHMGEWLTYIASLSAIDRIQRADNLDDPGGASHQMAVSTLMVIRLLPNIFLSPFGGALADSFDRRKCMIALDLLGALIAWLYVFSVESKSITLIYVAAFLQECANGMYEPSRQSIVPLMISNEEQLQKAITLTSIAWSVITAVGSGAGGILVQYFGIQGCYMIDSVTYLLSASLTLWVRGKFDVSTANPQESGAPTACSIWGGLLYLGRSCFGPLAFLKGCASLVYGASDVLDVSFAQRGSIEGQPTRLGFLFTCVGVGACVAPIICEGFVDMNRPRTMQRAAVVGLLVLTTGFAAMSIPADFWVVCVLSTFRAMGSSVVWVSSTLLLQKFCPPEFLGRVSSVDFSSALLGEVPPILTAGLLQDGAGWTPEQVCLFQAGFGMLVFGAWLTYDCLGMGAAQYQALDDEDTQSSDSEEKQHPNELSPLLP